MLLPNGKQRQYSLTVCEPNPERYLIGVKRDPASRGGSAYMHDEVKAGQTLKIRPPRNHFPLVENAPHVVLIAGGIGVTPIYCMAQRLAALGRSWELHYSCRSRADMAFREELSKFKEAHLHFDDESGGKFLDMAAIVAKAPKAAHLYCCGPMPMLKAFEAATAEWPRAQIHVEYFAPKQEPAKTGGFVVELAKSGQEFVIPEGKTILQVLLDAGVYVDYSCELGICGLCQTAAALRHARAPRRLPHRRAEGGQRHGHDLLRGQQERPAGAGLITSLSFRDASVFLRHARPCAGHLA